MGTLLSDVRYGIRMLRKSPGFTAVAAAALALGIGANTVMFSSIEAMLLRPFAFQDLSRAVALWETEPTESEEHLSVAPSNFFDWRDWNRHKSDFDMLAASHSGLFNLTRTAPGNDVVERVEGARVTSDFFALLGVPAEAGRSIAAGDFEAGRSSVVVLGHGFWQRHLGGDPQVVGSNLLLDGEKLTVIGVMPADFDFPVGTEAWAPLDLTAAEKADRTSHYLQAIGRLRSGVSIRQAQADLDPLAARLGRDHPGTNAGHGIRVVGLVADMTTGSAQFLGVLMSAAGFVLLLACANVANLHLARSTARQRELALRRALGATRWQIAQQLLVEGVAVSMLGALAGLVLASWGLEVMGGAVPPFIVQHVPGLKHLVVDSRALAFTVAVGFLSGVLAALPPAFHASHGDLNDVLKEGGRGSSSGPGRSRLRSLLVVSEIALALVLLIGAGLMVKGFCNLLNADPGFDRTHVLTFHVGLSKSKYQDSAAIRSFYDQVIQGLQNLPGAESAAAVTSLPSGWGWNSTEYRAEGQAPAAPGEMRLAISQFASPEFFRTLRIPLLKGRYATPEDGPDSPPVVVISASLARVIWPHEDPVGKRLLLGGGHAAEPWRTVVGVVGDIKRSSWDTGPDKTAYVPFDQLPQASMALAVRATGDPLALAGAARAALRRVDPGEPPYDVRTLEQLISDNISGVDFSARLMLVFGALALALAAAGIYGVMAYSVEQRTHEIGVRMALGARRADVLRLVLGRAMRLAAVGLAAGIPCAVLLTRALSSLLFGIIRMDAPTFAGFTFLLTLIAAIAAYLPARSATRVDPMVALRHE